MCQTGQCGCKPYVFYPPSRREMMEKLEEIAARLQAIEDRLCIGEVLSLPTAIGPRPQAQEDMPV